METKFVFGADLCSASKLTGLHMQCLINAMA